MGDKFILTAFGKDRPGIVADVARVLFENGCNLEDSTMTRLADEFTIILLLSDQGQENLMDKLSKECRRLEMEKGVSAFVRPVSDPKGKSAENYTEQTFHIEGMDQVGIVYKISNFMSEKGVNIANLRSKVSFSPESGSAMYYMEVNAEVPNDISMDDLDDGFAQISDELHIDITR
ncbi:ACT domain-containing protein [Desulfobacterales bacterium HSG16]|nr:ACT domain-containing protein [Desulfobacterales bacterium HSG16]